MSFSRNKWDYCRHRNSLQQAVFKQNFRMNLKIELDYRCRIDHGLSVTLFTFLSCEIFMGQMNCISGIHLFTEAFSTFVWVEGQQDFQKKEIRPVTSHSQLQYQMNFFQKTLGLLVAQTSVMRTLIGFRFLHWLVTWYFKLSKWLQWKYQKND